MGKSFLVAVTNDLNQDQRMHRICKTLADDGNEVLFLGRLKPNSNDLLQHNFSQERLRCFFSKGFLFYLEYNIRLLFFILKNRPDVIYSVDLDTLLACGIAARVLNKKLIHDAHEYFVEVPELEGQNFKKWIWNRIGLSFIPRCQLCFSVNQELAKILSDKYNNTFYVVKSVPNITNEKVSKVYSDNGDNVPVVLYQGMLNKGRGLEETINAVCHSSQEVKFRIAGEGDISKLLRTLKNKLDTKNRIEFLGWLSPDELKQETLKADFGLNLLTSESLNYKYSLANKFFDYMHAGVPSINMNFPVYRRICETYEVGICIDSLDEHVIQNAIKGLTTDIEKVNRIKKAIESGKKEYNWDKESQVLLRHINGIIANI